jgi:hypothetical protein
MIEGRIKDLEDPKFQGAQCRLRNLAAEEFHARIFAILRPARKRHPGVLGTFRLGRQIQMASPLWCIQGCKVIALRIY